jgi:hypothetical protein
LLAEGLSPTDKQSAGLRSQAWLAPARNRPTTWALPLTCVKSRRTSAGASSWNRPTPAVPPAGAQVENVRFDERVSIVRSSLAPCVASVPKSTSAVQETVTQAGKLVHCGSEQSTSLLALSSMPLSQISVPIMGLQARLPMQSESAQSILPSKSSSRLLLQTSIPGFTHSGSPKQPGS